MCWVLVGIIMCPVGGFAVTGKRRTLLPQKESDITTLLAVRDGNGDRESADLAKALSDALARTHAVRILPPPADAAAPAEPAESLLARAKAAFLAFDHPSALAAARQAVLAAEAAWFADPEAAPILPEALLTLASVEHAANHFPGMDAALQRLAAIAPRYSIDPAVYPPTLRAAFDATRRSAPDSALLVAVDVDIAAGGGGTILVRGLRDGAARGTWRPMRIRFDAGRQTLHEDLARLTTQLVARLPATAEERAPLIASPAVDDPPRPASSTDGDRRKRRVSPIVWGAVGVGVVGGILGGLLAARGGGGTGTLQVSFR
ncbi:MAG: hypothetical protein HY543_04300 [Deltaproteobacteria bacterium]|nr:hypothetical protein [Deltaproteobacteria bacterium]